ncbi:IS21 family transposase [Portibacter lacus]|uniref:Integrase n=1 Tax=Portibacter lacus TaxID=1099794 RepID=A0AA37SLD6_9BACT|nr:IS21 family transposase [Portibacter lacus]GLR16157.1 integrase [Portibacter lacus]
MGKIKRMDQVRLILRTYRRCGSFKEAARRLKMSKNTIKNYVKIALNSGEELDKIVALSEESFTALFHHDHNGHEGELEKTFLANIPLWLKELTRPGVSRQLIWEEYRKDNPQGYCYSQFCAKLKRHLRSKDLTIALTHEPGDTLQVDFAGKKLSWVDSKTGEVNECEVLVTVCPFSHFCFVIALPSQKVADFVYGINQALRFLGKLPKKILSDNLKSYVTTSDRYEPKFNDLCVQLADHYNLELQATRPRKPKDKASVENAVRIAYQRIYAPLRNEVFHSIEELNRAIIDQLAIHNQIPFQKKEGCRKELFEQYEKPLMAELPNELFELKKSTKAKVQKNYHVFLGEEKNYYSVPHQYVGKYAIVLYNRTLVEIYIDRTRVAVHQRLTYRNCNRYQTNDKHLPKNHEQWKASQGYDGAYFIKQAAKIGESTEWLIQQVLIAKIYEAQTYKSCAGILHLAKRFTPQRVEAAALRCKKVGKGNYPMMKNILAKNLDRSDEVLILKIPTHDNIRGPQAYH